ncbi:hypothetical protein [Absidia glauca]|uniref:Uncharacterized protein n=1 Tax=Absidia glauca TaxID=4829 RepID=A0A168MEP2_ABSGL|nr:hypothetical protein [Absidia glauca]
MRETGKRRRNGMPKYEAYFIGVKAILQQRGLWHDMDGSEGRQGMKWRLFCGNNTSTHNNGNTECCARHCLANQEDFLCQRGALQEALHPHHIRIDFYPKFYCECNWIERYWADIKRYARKNCDYTYAGLQKTLEDGFNEASPPDGIPTKMRRYYMRCLRYIDAYSRQLNVEEAEVDVCSKFRNTTYISHRKLAWAHHVVVVEVNTESKF